jgi:hypothetical protein
VAGENSKIEYTYGWYSASAEINDMQGIIKGKAIVRLKAEMRIYLTLQLLAHIYYVKIVD